jgi:antitoxin HicB
MFYNCNITLENGMYIAQFPDIPNALTYGNDYKEAITMAADVLDAVLTTEIEDGHKIPAPMYKGGVPITVFPNTEKLLQKRMISFNKKLAFA